MRANVCPNVQMIYINSRIEGALQKRRVFWSLRSILIRKRENKSFLNLLKWPTVSDDLIWLLNLENSLIHFDLTI